MNPNIIYELTQRRYTIFLHVIYCEIILVHITIDHK